MRLTRSSTILAVIGVLLLVAAALVRFVLLPSVSKLPTDLDTSEEFEGTYSGLNQAALTGQGPGDLLLEDVPVTATRTYTADESEGDTLLVTRTIERSIGGQEEPQTQLRYAIDRADFDSAAAPSGADDVVASEGLVFTLPMNPDTDAEYLLWDQTTEAAYPLEYEDSSTIEGRTALEFRSVAEGEVPDPAALGLPTELPKVLLTSLPPAALAELLPPELLAQLPAVLPLLPDVIPLSYTSATTSTVFADSEIGSPLRAGSEQQITAQLALGPQTIEVPFATIVLDSTEDAVAENAEEAADNASQLNLVGTVLPIVLAVLGLLLIVLALVLAARAGRRGRGAGTPTSSGATAAPVSR